MSKEKRVDRMGLVLIMSHLVITLVVLGIYAYSLFAGVEDETLRTILTVIVGYWFGALGNDAIKKRVVKKNVDEKKGDNE